MAKNALGRGLGSLLGGTYESDSQKPVTPTRQSSPIPVQDTGSIPRITVKAPADIAQPATRVPEKGVKEIKEPVKTEETVVIKSVSARNPEELPATQIHRNPNQPRINFKKDELDELAASIKKDGLLQPILVRPEEDGTYMIIAGERRYRACLQAGMQQIPVRIKEVTDEQILELALVENIQRSDLNPIEEAYGYRRLMDKRNLTQSEVAQMVSKGRSTIANALRLLELPEDAQQLLYEEKITAGHARAILSIPTMAGKQKLTDKLIQEKISVREAEQIARLLSAQPNAAAKSTHAAAPKSYKMVARTLREKLETGVKVKTSQGRNRIEIEFKDEEDLQRVFGLMFAEQKAEEPAETE